MEIVNGLSRQLFLQKHSIIDTWHGPEYASVFLSRMYIQHMIIISVLTSAELLAGTTPLISLMRIFCLLGKLSQQISRLNIHYSVVMVRCNEILMVSFQMFRSAVTVTVHRFQDIVHRKVHSIVREVFRYCNGKVSLRRWI